MRRIVSKHCSFWKAHPLHHATVVIAVGANVPGNFGTPHESFARAFEMLRRHGVVPRMSSHVYETAAVGIGRQPVFINAVVAVTSPLPAAALLRLLKHIERRAGRRFCRPSGARPLDLDIICFRGQVVSRPHRRRARGSLILPHPEMLHRRFVLEPLAEIAPHLPLPYPVGPIRRSLGRLPRPPGSLRRSLDLAVEMCDETGAVGGNACK